MDIDFNGSSINIWPIAIVLLVSLVIFLKIKNHNSSYLFWVTLFSLYILLLIDRTLFPIRIYEEGIINSPDFISRLNLIPFYFGRSTNTGLIAFQIVGNIILTIPFGFGLSLITTVRAKSFLWIPFVVGIGIELSQLLVSFAIGRLYRVIDINDVILNALGVIIGYVLFRIVSWIYRAVYKPSGLLVNVNNRE